MRPFTESSLSSISLDNRHLLLHCLLTAGCAIDATTAEAHAESVTLLLQNGDKLTGELIREDSNATVKVILHPNLGRLEIKVSDLKPIRKPSTWSGSLALGVNGSNSDADFSAGGTASLATRYKTNIEELSFSAQAQLELSRDNGETTNTTDTNQGDANLRYTRQLNPRLNAYAASVFDYDTLNDVGSNTLTNSVGLGIDVVKTKTTTINLSAGPSLQSIWGGSNCDTSATCGVNLAGGSARASLNWTPNQYFNLLVSNQFNGAYLNGISPSNTFSGTLKIFPNGSKKLFTALTGKTIYNSLTLPKVNNSFSVQVGTQFN